MEKKLKPIIEANLYSQGKKTLIVNLFETCNIRDEINKYISSISTYGYFYGDDEKLMVENGVYKKLVEYYVAHYEYKELQELFRFYKSDLGMKVIETNGFLSLKLIESIVNSELKYR